MWNIHNITKHSVIDEAEMINILDRLPLGVNQLGISVSFLIHILLLINIGSERWKNASHLQKVHVSDYII